MKKLIIIDGNSLLFRAYFATAGYGDESQIMKTRSGIPTNAIFAFGNMLTKILNSLPEGTSIFVGFDADSKTFRKEEYAEYKANRKPAPENLIPQFAISRELLTSLGIFHYEQHGVEADDLCGTIAKMASKEGYEVLIYTSDKDYLQLIDENISVSLLKVGLSNMDLVNNQNMVEKFGFTPKQIIDFKGLRGDSSDNLPGIPGVGDKTAVKLINDYGNIDAIFEAAKEMKGKIGENLRTYEEQGRTCYRLATIKTDVELDFGLEDLLYQGYEFQKANDFTQKYELKQFAGRLPVRWKRDSGEKAIEVKQCDSSKGISWKAPIGLSLDVDFGEYHDETPAGIALSNGQDVYYFPWDVLKNDSELKAMLEDPSIQKDVYDGKATIYALASLGIKIQGIENDLLLASYLLDSSVNDNPSLVLASFGVDLPRDENEFSLLSEGHPILTGNLAYRAHQLSDKAKQLLLSADAYRLYHEVEMPLMKVLAKMELEGFPIHREILEDFGKEFKRKRDTLQAEIYQLAGEAFNINSPKQIAEVLFEKMGIKNPRGGSTSIEALGLLLDEHPIIEKILEYRKYAKLLGTYVDGIIPHIKEDQKIHSYFNQAQTSTGRLSSSSPNLQNISARDPESKQIRKAFYYDDPDLSLVSLDYGQIELRILASLADCKPYIDVFEAGHDVHAETAKRIFHAEEVTPLMRRRAKAINFAIIYGTTVYGLAEQIESTPQEASRIIKDFYLSYPEIDAFNQKTTHDALTKGYVTTMFGRRRYLRDINDPNYAKREAAKRAALNAPVQGSAADLIKVAMVKIDDYLTKNRCRTKMVLQIHDELIFAVPKEEMEAIVPILKDIMVHAIPLKVRLTAEEGIGRTWYDIKD